MDTTSEIKFSHLTKQFGALTAVNDLSFTVRPGRVTGFLGPNGSGKTTTLRMLLGLTNPTSGTATFGDTHYTKFTHPSTVVGAALEASSFHPGRTAQNHLRVYAPIAGVDDARVNEVLDLVGLTHAAKQRVGGFSMGMRQRLALAAALLADPKYLILDEPANGLDPQGIRWLREFLRYLASQGKTILVSSHILSEVQQSVDDVVIISQGKLRHASPIAELSTLSTTRVRLVSPDVEKVRDIVATNNWNSETDETATYISGLSTAEVGTTAFKAGIEVHELTDLTESLEEAFLRLTAPENGTTQVEVAR
ncbi:ATP-binding cassette domain-containing protein [Timonella sp. A28]|uniref:ATP-binding cassette domain-containing protein n=1 Tax=Timonella sp. A28 TaxID=3442640 RepID=UPI003EBDDBEB